MNGKILVVEDDPVTSHFYKLVLKHCELEAVITENADEIFSHLEGGEVKLIIMDINLRNTVFNGKIISGIELSKMIKSEEKYGNPKIVLVSAYNLDEDDPDFIKSKADKFILKPISDFNLFLNIIRGLLNG